MVAVCEVETGRLLVELSRHGPNVYLTWQGSYFVTLDEEGIVLVRDGASGASVREPPMNLSPYRGYSPMPVW